MRISENFPSLMKRSNLIIKAALAADRPQNRKCRMYFYTLMENSLTKMIRKLWTFLHTCMWCHISKTQRAFVFNRLWYCFLFSVWKLWFANCSSTQSAVSNNFSQTLLCEKLRVFEHTKFSFIFGPSVTFVCVRFLPR